MSRYKFGSGVRDELKSISAYIAQENPGAVRRLSSTFRVRFQQLAGNPQMGEARPDLGPQIRQTTHGNYVILFRPLRSGVEIVHVVHGARDWETLFRGQGG